MTRGILARHDRDSGRRANAHGVKIVEANSSVSEAFHVGGPVPIVERMTLWFTAFVGQEGDRSVHDPHIVYEEDDNVRLLCLSCGR